MAKDLYQPAFYKSNLGLVLKRCADKHDNVVAGNGLDILGLTENGTK